MSWAKISEFWSNFRNHINSNREQGLLNRQVVILHNSGLRPPLCNITPRRSLHAKVELRRNKMILNKYKFSKEQIKLCPKVSGIYALIHNQEIIYIGQSKSLRQRLQHHYRAESALQGVYAQQKEEQYQCNREYAILMYKFIIEHKDELEFLILPVEVEKLNEIELLYISKYQPKFNYAGKEKS